MAVALAAAGFLLAGCCNCGCCGSKGCSAACDIQSYYDVEHGTGPLEHPDWMIGPFKKRVDIDPCFGPSAEYSFFDPVKKMEIKWMERNAYNTGSIVKDDKVYLLFRAEDVIGKYNGTSRVGLAWSEDGEHFEVYPTPVIYPDNDEFLQYENEGGCEDPRVIEDRDGTYYIYYTAYAGKVALLCCATSRDLIHWDKKGLCFGQALGGKYAHLWSKSGAVVTKEEDGHFYPVKLNGKYWMYWGESNIYAATSDDLINWEPCEFLPDGSDINVARRVVDNQVPSEGLDKRELVLQPVIICREGLYDGMLCEPGPQAILTEKGIVLIYHGKGWNPDHDGIFYASGQLLLDPQCPTAVLARTTKPFIWPTEKHDLWAFASLKNSGNVFLQNLVRFKGRYMLYYGAGDHECGVAESAPLE